MTPRVVLVGAPGAGKTTIGRQLARRLGVEFRDTDSDIETAMGMPITDIFVSLGEPAFRHQERISVAEALAEHSGVLSLGGGAVLDSATRALLQGHTVVWLDVDLTNAAARVGMNTSRPLLLGNVRSTLKTLLEDRAPLYAEVASVKFATGETTPSSVVDRIVEWLENA